MNLSLPVVCAPRRLCAPLLLSGLMASMLLAAPDAHAGTWQFTCTGSGSETEDTRTPTIDDTRTQNWVPPGPSTGSYYQLGGFSVATQPGQFSTTQANTTKSGGGTISAAVTLTWVPAAGQTAATDPPPTSVLLNESSSASWTAQVDNYPDPYTTGGTSADDGLGDAEAATYYGGVKNGGTSSSASPHYTVKSLTGGTLTLNRSFSAHATASTGSSDAGVNFGFSFGSYTLAVASPMIKITGTYNPSAGDYHVLTGQQITATLQGLSGYTVTKYTWAVGGSAFKTYNETAPSNQLVPLGSKDLTGPASGSSTVAPLNFYDSAQENLTVTCTATVLAPDGTTLNITATAPQINVLKPTLTRWDIAEGYVQLNPNTSNGAAYGLYGNLSGSTDASTNGMIWSNVAVSVPSPFSGNGRCTFTQLINPNRLGYNGNSSTPLVPNNGILGLDGSFNYGNSWSVTAVGSDVDSPNQPTSYASYTELSASDALTTYVMYQPSGGVWVPLQKISWSWSVTINRQTSTSPWSLTASYPATAGQAGIPTHVPISDPPQWSVVH